MAAGLADDDGLLFKVTDDGLDQWVTSSISSISACSSAVKECLVLSHRATSVEAASTMGCQASCTSSVQLRMAASRSPLT